MWVRKATLAGALVCAGALLAAVAWTGLTRRHATPAAPPAGAADQARAVPLSVAPRAEPLLAVRPEETERLLRKIGPLGPGRNTVSLYLHVLRVHGLGASRPDPGRPAGATLLDELTDEAAGRAAFGSPALVRARTGARYPTSGPGRFRPSEETHRDQVLAAFAEFGVPLCQPLRFPDETLTVREVLRDSVANFHLRQAELVWTALAYALYLPPQRSWVNRYGEQTTFDELTAELLDRPFNKASCGGTHLLFTLTVLARADAQADVLSGPTRERLWQRLRQARDAVVASQAPDGTWPLDWFQGLGDYPLPATERIDPTDRAVRLLTTSHLAEWLLYLPPELAAPRACLERAGYWLYEQLRAATPAQELENFCPYAHAACVVKRLCPEGRAEAAPAPRAKRGGQVARLPGPQE